MDLKIKITNVKKVKLEKGDTLFFEIGGVVNNQIMEHIATRLKEVFPNQEVVVFPKEIKLKKIGHKKE